MSRPTDKFACLLTIGFGILLLNACSTKQVAMAPDVLKDLKLESQITIVHYRPEPFSIYLGERTGLATASGVPFGIIGVAIEAGMAAADAKKEAIITYLTPILRSSILASTSRRPAHETHNDAFANHDSLLHRRSL